jgi:hypothetical protein
MEREEIGNSEDIVEPVIYMDEIEAQLRSLEETSPEGFSISEMAEKTGKSEFWCRKKMKVLVKAGKAKYNGKKPCTMLDGRRYYAPVYAIKG